MNYVDKISLWSPELAGGETYRESKRYRKVMHVLINIAGTLLLQSLLSSQGFSEACPKMIHGPQLLKLKIVSSCMWAALMHYAQ